MPEATKVYSVEEVTLSLRKSNPPVLVIEARGQVNTSGWGLASLVPHVYVAPPEDGIYDFDFVAQPPDGIVLQAFQPITALPFEWADPPIECKGVRVHAATNKMERKL